MARITFSPILVDARGKVGDAVFSIWKGINYLRSRVTPANPQSDDQTICREALADCLTLWQSIKVWAKQVWTKAASGYPLSGYNLFMKQNIPLTKADGAEIGTPYNEDYVMSTAQTIATGAGTTDIDCAWTADPEVEATDKVFAIYHKVDTFAFTKTDDVLNSAEALTIDGLEAEALYSVCLIPYNTVTLEHQESKNVQCAASAA